RERLQNAFEDEKLAQVCKVTKFSHILKDKSIKIWEPRWDQEQVEAEAPLVFGPTPDKKEQEEWGRLLAEVEQRSERTGGVPYPIGWEHMVSYVSRCEDLKAPHVCFTSMEGKHITPGTPQHA